MESVLSITCSQKCSFIHLVISIENLLASISNMRKTGIGRGLRNESITCRPLSLNSVDKSLREVLDFLCRTSFTFVISFAFYHEIWIYVFEILREKYIKIWHFRNISHMIDSIVKPERRSRLQ